MVPPMRIRARLVFAAGVIAALAAPISAAPAAEQSPDATGLPGVDGQYRIVKPVPPEPEPDDARPDGARYGRWDVTVSGKLTIDVGAGDLPSPEESGN
jgi:hypothetical protein